MPHHKHRRSRDRSRSPRRHDKSARTRSPAPKAPRALPLGASQLKRHDYEAYKPMFGLYLEIQKQKVLEELPEDEAKGRWKSFMSKWNRGELAEGWYDPATLERAHESMRLDEQNYESSEATKGPTGGMDSEDEDDEVGPSLPTASRRDRRPDATRSGPAIPSVQDLEMQSELREEDREVERDDLRYERKMDRKMQKERLDELAPRAESGTKDRQLEKKREKADSNRAFAATKAGGDGLAEVAESDLMGDDGGVEGFKKRKAEVERKKNERELRREEIMRAKAAEREARVRAYKEKEEETMSGLVALAKARFG